MSTSVAVDRSCALASPLFGLKNATRIHIIRRFRIGKSVWDVYRGPITVSTHETFEGAIRAGSKMAV